MDKESSKKHNILWKISKIYQYAVFKVFSICELTVDNMWIKYKIIPMSHVLAIDQGTSSSRTIIFDTQLRKVESLQE